MSRSIMMALALGVMLGAACKKKENDTAASQQPAKTQEPAQPQTKDTPKPDQAEGPGIAAGGIERAADEGSAAMIASASGTVEVRRVGETTWTAAKADTKLWPGDVVRTSDQSAATIMLADQSTIEVSETSSVAIASRDGSADPASSAAVMAGLARFTVSARTPGEGAFRVYTPSAIVLTKGTTYGVGVAASGEARIGVETGTVEVIGISSLDAQPVELATSSQVMIAADGKVGTSSAWATDDWGMWRDEVDAKADYNASIKAHGEAMAELDKALASSWAELQANADAAATFEATAATSAEKNDTAAYTAAQADGAATIDASFALAGRIEALTWAYASHATLATEIYTRHPETQASWEVVMPRVDASVLWPKRFEVTAAAFWQPLRTQYYVHHPRGRMHAQFVGITVPAFYASVPAQPVEPTMVRGKLKGQIWIAPQLAYKPSPRPLWAASPSASWNANAKVMVAPPRAKVAWYVRPATLKSTTFIGAPVKAAWQSKLTVGAPQPRAALASSWKIAVGTKIKVDPPNMDAAAKARATAKMEMPKAPAMAAPKVDAKGAIDAKANAAVDAKAKVSGKVDVAVPPPPKVDVKGHADATVKAGADVKSKVDGAVKANADVKVKAPEVKVKAPEVKVDAKVKAKGGVKLGM
jgi:hypothetical protein